MLKKRKSRDSFYPGKPWRSYCLFPIDMEPGNKAEILVDATEAYPAMLTAISGARRTILMDSYIFNNDKAGRLFKEALIHAAARGVETYLIVDAVGTLLVEEAFFDEMRHEGVHVLEYRSWAPWKHSFGFLRRNHRKMLVVDGIFGFVGGLNIGSEWLSAREGGREWHDIHIRVEGPAVRSLSKLAMSTWHGHAGIMLDPGRFLPDAPRVGSEYVCIIGSREHKKRKAIRKSYLHAIRRAQEYIYIANGYFLPDLGFRRALKNAVKRGVDVRVMVPKEGDILSVQMASQALFGRLMSMGVRLLLWQNALLHAKTATIDGQWTSIGSYNIDRRSWSMNLEVNVNVMGPTVSNRLREVFQRDEERCLVLTPMGWKRRPLLIKLLEKFFYLFRKLM
jgi:cardiolipin synthase